jgi:hypothetical protein
LRALDIGNLVLQIFPVDSVDAHRATTARARDRGAAFGDRDLSAKRLFAVRTWSTRELPPLSAADALPIISDDNTARSLAYGTTFIPFSFVRRPDAARCPLGLRCPFLAAGPLEKPLLPAWKSRMLALEFADQCAGSLCASPASAKGTPS